MNKFYITTPIYYPSENLHIGHAYTSVIADALSRYYKQKGIDTYFLTGTDEHGQKIERRAKKDNLTPKEYVDNIVKNIKQLWKMLNVDYDDFIRTTDDRHIAVVQKIFKQLYENGDIYKSEYEGWYCTSCEAFFTELQLVDGCCPDCGKSVENHKEESYFFKLSKYQDWLIDYINTHDEFIMPESRKNEMLNNFLKPGLSDLCVSRTSVKWGIPVDFDNKHTVYVWIDALSNYISALGYLSDDDTLFKKYWPADLHLVGKEIIRFHCIIWPIILRALNLPIPNKIFGHGWLVIDGQKMSKSIGNVIDPMILCDKYGSDSVRYFLLKGISFGNDANFSYESFLKLINSDLCNTLGNLVSRSISMAEKYFNGKVKNNNKFSEEDNKLIYSANTLISRVDSKIQNLEINLAIEEIMLFASDCNKYIDIKAPWILAKDESKILDLENTIYVLLEAIKLLAIVLHPFIPNTTKEILAQLNLSDESADEVNMYNFGSIKEYNVKKTKNLFPRIDVDKELQLLEEKGDNDEDDNNIDKIDNEKSSEYIDFETFEKIDIAVGTVLKCKKVEKSEKLLVFEIDFGGELRTIVSGISKFYNPESLIGKQIIAILNLKPRKVMGIMSQGMILSALDKNINDEKLVLLSTEKEVGNGARIG